MIARYDFAVELNTFDYYGWQAQVAAMGATEIVFDIRQLKDRRKFHSIIMPGPAMLGLPSRIGTDGDTLASSRLRHLVPFMRRHSFPRLKSVKPAGFVKYTVTLRRRSDNPSRNSCEDIWRTFAAEIGAVVIEDYEVEPIDLYDRMALYAGAEMNFGIVCGPLVMCQLSPYPVATFGWDWCWGNGFYEKAGLSYGEPMPWLGPNQFTLWEQPTLDSLRLWFDDWKATQHAESGYRSHVDPDLGILHHSMGA